MRSIRLALVVYFLLLLGLALAAVSCFVYHTTHQTLLDKKATTQRLLEEKEASTRELLQTQFEDRVREEQGKLDLALESQAQTLAALVKAQAEGARMSLVRVMARSGLLTAGLNPGGFASIPIWASEESRSPLSYQMHHAV